MQAASPTSLGPGFMYDAPQSPRRSSAGNPGSSMTEDYDIPRPSPRARMSSPDVSSRGYQTMPARKPPQSIPKLQRQNSHGEVYDIPVKQYSDFQETYDVPATTHWASPAKSASPAQSVEQRSPTSSEVYDTPTKHNGELMVAEVYDVPPSVHGVALPMKQSEIARVSCASHQEYYIFAIHLENILRNIIRSAEEKCPQFSKVFNFRNNWGWPISFTLARRKQCETPNNVCEDQNKGYKLVNNQLNLW